MTGTSANDRRIRAEQDRGAGATATASQGATVGETLQRQFDDLTRAERQLADVLLAHYPSAGLNSITGLASAAQVSTPTVARLVKKLGFSGYRAFQASLRSELDARVSSPISKRENWTLEGDDTHLLNRFAEVAVDNLQATLNRLDTESFDRIAALMADRDRRILIAGGRITKALADYLYNHLQVVRDGVAAAALGSSGWPHQLLNMRQGDVLVIFDIRRYERELLHCAAVAREQGLNLVLFTDQWGSPVADYADDVVHARVEAPSAWDSSAVTLIVIEALIAAIETIDWGKTRKRMEALEDLFDRTGMLRKSP
jgi:DNA-binding MurR/RpiR family transcriptional regulator